MCVHFYVHTHLLLRSPCRIRDVGWDPPSVARVHGVTMYICITVDLALHCCVSVIDSVQLVMPLRSQLMRSHQRRGAPPVGLPLPLGLHLNSCLRAAGGHSPDMAKPLKASLPKLFLHWHHPCSLQDVSVPNLVPQGDPQDVTKASEKDFSLRMSCWVTVHVSGSQRSTDNTKV